MSADCTSNSHTVYQKSLNFESDTPMPISDKLEVKDEVLKQSKKLNNSMDERTRSIGVRETNDSTASDILHLYGKKNTARVRLSVSYSENGTRSYMEQPQSLEECLETDDDLRFNSRTCRCLPKRYLLALLSFFGFFNVYCLRVDLSVALVAMTTNYTRIKKDGTEFLENAEFEWSRELQGHLISAFYYGYIITQIPGGYIAARFGGKNLFGMSILISGLLTLLTPIAAKEHWVLLFVLRMIEGLCEGCIYPAMYAIWSRWAPPNERASLVTIPHSGAYAGSVAGTLLAGYLCEVCGWSWVFYIFGIFALMWVAVWQIMVSDSPENDRHISSTERQMILKSLKEEHTSNYLKGDIPWLSILTSLPFLSIAVAHTCEGWAFGLIQTSFPKYLNEALNFRIFKSGQYTAIIYVLMGFSVFLSGQLSSCLRQRQYFSATTLRKLFTLLGFGISAVAFMTSPNVHVPELSATLMILGAGLEGVAWAGFGVNHLDIAPRYASLLIGITNTCATVPSIVVPVLVGIVSKTGERNDWIAVFYISGLTLICGTVFYTAFGSAERQSWADNEKLSEDEMEERQRLFSSTEDELSKSELSEENGNLDQNDDEKLKKSPS